MYNAPSPRTTDLADYLNTGCKRGDWSKLNCGPLVVHGNHYSQSLRNVRNVVQTLLNAMSGPFSKAHNCTNLLASGPLQDDGSPADFFDPILATLEVYPLPAETLAGVQTRTGCSQEGCRKATPTANEERLA